MVDAGDQEGVPGDGEAVADGFMQALGGAVADQEFAAARLASRHERQAFDEGTLEGSAAMACGTVCAGEVTATPGTLAIRAAAVEGSDDAVRSDKPA